MLRSVDIPTKLLMGYHKNDWKIYHSWNQVWLSEKECWITIDSTYDAVATQNKKHTEMIKNESDYILKKVY